VTLASGLWCVDPDGVRRIAFVGWALLAACRFTPAAVGDGGGLIDAPTDARPDATDALASNARRKLITIAPTQIAGSETDFPLWLDINDTDIGSRALADGSDIYFTSPDGATQYDYQITLWDKPGHHLQAWVRLPTLANPTTLLVNYGDPAPAPVQNPRGVFKNAFAAVWHLDDATTANNSVLADATAKTTAKVAGSDLTAHMPAQLGTGVQFPGSMTKIGFINPLSGSAPHTISAWVKQPALTPVHTSAILAVGTGSSDQARWFYSDYMSPQFAIGFYADDWLSGTSVEGNAFMLVHWVYQTGTNNTHLYINGHEVTGGPKTFNNVDTQGATGVIGNVPDTSFGSNGGLQATLDELRIATVARDVNWVTDEFNNQSSPSTFYSLGPELP